MLQKKICLLLMLTFNFIFLNGLEQKTFLVYGGKTGWVGQKIVKLLENDGYRAICASARLENRQDIIKEIELIKPHYIINAAGITGKPNIDWCEDHKQETIRTNIIGTLNLADITNSFNIHLTNFSTGCIYEYDKDHTIDGKGFLETDEPNFFGSFYSKTKAYLEKLLLNYPNILNLRIRMPISPDLHPRNFITKIINYKKVVNIKNSLSVLDDLLPIAIDMTLKNLKGNYNFVNPGTMSHNEILDLYKKIIDTNFKYENFSLEEQAKILKAGRSNCQLDPSKLLKLYPTIPNIHESMINVLNKMRKEVFENNK